jgi:hypothetical protein
MHGNAVQEATATLPGSASQKRFRRAFVRSLKLGRRPTVVEAQLINRAVAMTFEAQRAMADPHCTDTDRVRLDRCARLARRDAVAAIANRREPALTSAAVARIAAIFQNGDAA